MTITVFRGRSKMDFKVTLGDAKDQGLGHKGPCSRAAQQR